MACRTVRLIMAGLIGAAAAVPATAANAGDVIVNQPPTIAVRKHPNPGSRRTNLSSVPGTLTGLQLGDGLVAASGATLRAPASSAVAPPLSGLSLENLSLAPPLSGPDPARPGQPDAPSLSQKNGNIVYSVVPNAGFTPYVGVGAGRAPGTVGSGPSRSNAYGGDALHSYQGLAGFAYKLDKDTLLNFDYRMSNTQRPDVPVDGANMMDSEHDRAAILSLHYALDPVLKRPR